MSINIIKKSLLLILSLSLISCAAEKSVSPANVLIDKHLNLLVKSDESRQKIDHFEIIFDSNESMKDPYMGQRKFDHAKDILIHVNETIPDLKMTSALRTFGLNFNTGKATTLIYGPAVYSKSGFEKNLKKIKYPLGDSLLNVAIDAVYEDVQSALGKKAIIIVSDGKNMDNSTVAKVQRIKNILGDQICIYAIQVGNDSAGEKLLRKMVRLGGCGLYIQSDRLVSSTDVVAFTEKIFLTSQPREVMKPANTYPSQTAEVKKGIILEKNEAKEAVSQQVEFTADSNQYIIGPEDILYINVWREETLSRSVPVRIDGKISLPLIDDVQADGLTPLQLKELLTNQLKTLIDNPTVSVTVMESNSFKVYVLGEVKTPGVRRIRSKTTFLELISMVGGFTEWANQKKILVIKKEKGTEQRFFVNYRRIIDGEESDVEILRNDTVIVQ
ncbi:MAG: polysaccharide biosynthesis/export family protein [Syntrophales bacterium]|jgi:polysaccharide export outer membrane protein